MRLAFPVKAALLAVFVHSLWGANPVAVKFGLEVFPPFWTGFIRFAIGACCVALWASLTGLKLWPKVDEWSGLLRLAVFFFVQITAMNIGYGLTPGSVASVLTSTYPLFAALFAHMFLIDDKLTRPKAIGLIVAFSGVSLVLLRDVNFGAGDFVGFGGFVVLLSATLLGGRMIFSAHLLRRIDPIRVVFWQALFSLPAFALGGLLVEEIRWDALALPPIAGLLYQGIVIAGFGFMVNTHMVKRYSPTLVNSFGFVSPISGVLLSLWLLQESLSWQVAVGTLTVAAGLVIITRNQAKP